MTDDKNSTDDQAKEVMPEETENGTTETAVKESSAETPEGAAESGSDDMESHAGDESGKENGPGMDLEDFSQDQKQAEKEIRRKSGHDQKEVGMEALYEIPVRITAVIGNATMPVSQLVKLGRGAVVELNRKLGDAVDIYANNRLIARGEVVVVDDEHIGVTMTEILSASPVNKA